MSLAELAHEVEGGLRQLDTPLLDVPPRHRSMHAVFDHSWRLLQPHLQSVLRQLSVFRGGCTRAAAAAVAGAALSDLGMLVDSSWLHARPSGRYEMHELIRQYCAEHLEVNPPTAVADRAEEACNRHHAFYRAFLHEQMHRMNYQQEVMADLMADFGNLQAAWMWSVGHGDMGVAKDMVISLYFIGEMLDWGRFVIEMLESAATMLESYLASPDGERRVARPSPMCWHGTCMRVAFCTAILACLNRPKPPPRAARRWRKTGAGRRTRRTEVPGRLVVSIDSLRQGRLCRCTPAVSAGTQNA